MFFSRWLEYKKLPELGSDPEDRSEFDEHNHDEVKECWAIELAGIEAREIARAEYILTWDAPSAQGRNAAIRSGHGEEK